MGITAVPSALAGADVKIRVRTALETAAKPDQRQCMN
nr:MAG TPA: hypothetical protein [Caudoviricetes sp.]